MALSRFILPYADVGSGIKPPSGAQLFFYETGTSQLKDTFTDPEGTIPNTNPVIADATGLFGDIFITGTYKVVLRSKPTPPALEGSQIWEADPVTSTSANELSVIARALNVEDGQVIYSTDTTTVLDDVLYIYDAGVQTTWGVPELDSTGKTIFEVVDDILTTTGGAGGNTYTLTTPEGFDYDSVQDMIDKQPPLGVTVTTRGFYSINDGGASSYVIESGIPDGALKIDLGGGLIASNIIVGVLFPSKAGVRADGTDGSPANHEIMQTLLNAGYKSFDFGGEFNHFVFNGQMGLPDQSLYDPTAFMFTANGASVDVNSTYALFTSKTIADNGGISLGGNDFTGKVHITGFNFGGAASNGVFDGDFLYNVHFYGNHCYQLASLTRSWQNKGASYPDGYFQSVYVLNNDFIQCDLIFRGKRGFNMLFKDNTCEACSAGLTINGAGQPALNNIRVKDNVFEGGGKFCSFGDALGGIISGNYIEKNSVNSPNSHIDLTFRGGSQFYDWDIHSNTAQDTQSQIDDTSFQMINLAGIDASAGLPIMQVRGNWTNSRVSNSPSLTNTIANTQGDRQSNLNMPSTPTEARMDFIRSFQSRTLVSNLVATEFKIATIDIPDGNQNNLDLCLDLNVLMKGQTPGAVDTCCAAAEIKVLLAATGTGASSPPVVHSVTSDMSAFTQQPDGTIIDTVGGYTGTILFNNPIVKTERDGTKVHIILTGWAAASVPNYGPIDKVRTYITAKANVLTANNNTAAKWITFTQ